MLPKTHILLGAIFSGILFLLFPKITLTSALIIWFSSFLIDIDHYIYYVLAEGDFSLRRAYKWHLLKRKIMKKLSRKERRKHKNEILFLHGIEIIFLLYLLSFFWKFLLFVAIGFVFHLFLDIYEEIKDEHRIDKISLIHDIIKYKRLKKLNLKDLEILKEV